VTIASAPLEKRGAAGLVELICPTAQAECLRQIGTTGKSLEQPQILSSEEHFLELSFVGVDDTPLRSQLKFHAAASTGSTFGTSLFQ
jgi:hypothetical protein